MYICPLPLAPPPTSHSFPLLWVVTEPEVDFSESNSKLPLAINFTHGSVQADFWRWRFLEKVASMLHGSDQKGPQGCLLTCKCKAKSFKRPPGIANCILITVWVFEGKVFPWLDLMQHRASCLRSCSRTTRWKEGTKAKSSSNHF